MLDKVLSIRWIAVCVAVCMLEKPSDRLDSALASITSRQRNNKEESAWGKHMAECHLEVTVKKKPVFTNARVLATESREVTIQGGHRNKGQTTRC